MQSTLQPGQQPPLQINTVDVYLVLTLARGDNPPPSFILDTRAYPFIRSPYDVYVFEYPDGSRYAVQIPIRMHDCPRTEIQELIEDEAANLEDLAVAKFPYSPRLVTYSATYANYLRFPYIIMTFIEGCPLEWSDTFPDARVRQWVLIQLAEIIYELTMCTLQQESDPEMTAERFLTDKIDKKMFQVIRKQMNDLSLQDCLYLRMLLRHISTMPNELYRDADQDVPNEQRHHIAAAALTHDNLCASNILVDEQYNIKGLINWSVTKRLPIRFALRLPHLLSIQPNPSDPSITHYVDLLEQTTFPSPLLTWSRTYYARSLRTVILDRAPSSALAHSTPLCMDTVDLDWKHWLLTAALSTKFHKWMRDNGYMLFRTVPFEKLVAKKKTVDLVREELVMFCEMHLLDYASRARKRSALRAVGEAFTGDKDWAWVEEWLGVQFAMKT